MEELAGRVADLCWAFIYGFRLERVDSLLIKHLKLVNEYKLENDLYMIFG